MSRYLPCILINRFVWEFPQLGDGNITAETAAFLYTSLHVFFSVLTTGNWSPFLPLSYMRPANVLPLGVDATVL